MNITNLFSNLLTLINSYIIPFLVAIAIVVFFFGLIKYIWSRGEDTTEAVRTITAGLIGLVVMLTVWGLVTLVANSLGVSGSQTIVLPQVH